MLDRFQILASRARHLFNRPRWSRWFLGDAAKLSDPNRPGLILIQIDGLGEELLRDVLQSGQMPFLKSLIEEEGYSIRSMYSGLPSSTPAVQAELFYGIPTVVPAFGYRDPEAGRVFSMNDPSAASTIEKRLRQNRRGLMRGGSSWTNIYSGGAAEPHLTASTVGVRTTLANLAPRRVLALVLFHSWSIVRVVATLVLMTALTFWDLLRGSLGFRRLLAELKFIPIRVVVSVAMREISTAGAEIDAGRGLPVIQMNFLGYDEHAHRRGPSSKFARWSLKGIDKSIRRVWKAAHRSRALDYQIWIYSDHGQEEVIPFVVEHGETVPSVVKRLYDEEVENEATSSQPERAAGTLNPTDQPTDHPTGRRPGGPTGNGSVGRVNQGADTPGRQPRRRKALGRFDQAEFEKRGDLHRDANVQTSSRSAWTGWQWQKLSPEEETTEASSRPDKLLITNQGPAGAVYFPVPRSAEFTHRLASRLANEGNIPLVFVPEPNRTAIAYNKRGRFELPAQAAEVFGQDHPHLERVARDTLRVVHHKGAGDLALAGWNPDQPLSLQSEWGAHGGPGPRETSAFLMLPPETRGFTYVPETLRPLQVRQLALRVLGRKGQIGQDETGDIDMYIPPVVVETDRKRQARLRILTYNVHGCRGTDGVFSPLRIARVIARERPDVVCLQELDQVRDRSGGIDQVQAIAKRLQSEYHFHAVSEMDDGTFGNAVLSLLPMRLIRKGPLPGLERMRSVLGLWERGAISVALTLGSEEVVVINTHLSVLPREQRLQARALLNDGWLDPPPGPHGERRPILLAGDFNAASHSETLKTFAEELRSVTANSPPGAHKTWTAQLPLRRIDHILHSDSIQTTQVYVPRTPLSRVASDHLPLVADVVCEFPPAP